MENSHRRTAQQVIDAAVDENRAAGRVIYGLAILAALVGLAVLLWACVVREPILALAGSTCTSLLWPAIRLVQQIRRENIALRLLEAPLSKAKTAIDAAEMLEHLFLTVFLDEHRAELKPKGQARSARGGGSV